MTSRIEDLRDMRQFLWESLREADADKRGPLFARLESVIAQIEKLSPSESEGDPVDEIAARRAARRPRTAPRSGRAKKSG